MVDDKTISRNLRGQIVTIKGAAFLLSLYEVFKFPVPYTMMSPNLHDKQVIQREVLSASLSTDQGSSSNSRSEHKYTP